MKNFISLLFGLLMIFSAGCKNVAYEKMKILEEQYRKESSDKALDQILAVCKSSNYWEKFYAISYLGVILDSQPDQATQTKIVSELAPLIDDREEVIADAATNSLSRASSQSLYPVIPDLVKSIRSMRSFSSTLNGIKILGKMRGSEKSSESVKVLMEILSQSSGNEKMRAYRSAAVVALGKLGPEAKIAVPELEKLLSGSNELFSFEVASAIHKLSPDNQALQSQLEKMSQSENPEIRRWAIDKITKSSATHQ